MLWAWLRIVLDMKLSVSYKILASQTESIKIIMTKGIISLCTKSLTSCINKRSKELSTTNRFGISQNSAIWKRYRAFCTWIRFWWIMSWLLQRMRRVGWWMSLFRRQRFRFVWLRNWQGRRMQVRRIKWSKFPKINDKKFGFRIKRTASTQD